MCNYNISIPSTTILNKHLLHPLSPWLNLKSKLCKSHFISGVLSFVLWIFLITDHIFSFFSKNVRHLTTLWLKVILKLVNKFSSFCSTLVSKNIYHSNLYKYKYVFTRFYINIWEGAHFIKCFTIKLLRQLS